MTSPISILVHFSMAFIFMEAGLSVHENHGTVDKKEDTKTISISVKTVAVL